MGCSGIPEAAGIMVLMATHGFVLMCLALGGCLEKLGGIIVITRCSEEALPPFISL